MTHLMLQYTSVNANFVRFSFYNSRKSKNYRFAIIVHHSRKIMDIRRALQLEGKKGCVFEVHITLAELPKFEEIDGNNNKKGKKDKVKTAKKKENVETVEKDKMEARDNMEMRDKAETRDMAETRD